MGFELHEHEIRTYDTENRVAIWILILALLHLDQSRPYIYAKGSAKIGLRLPTLPFDPKYHNVRVGCEDPIHTDGTLRQLELQPHRQVIGIFHYTTSHHILPNENQ